MQQHARPGDALASQDVLSLAPDAIGLSADASLALPNSLLLLKTVEANVSGVDTAEAHAKADALAWGVASHDGGHIKPRDEVLPYVAGSERAVISKGGVAAARAHRTALDCTVMVVKIVADYRNASSVQRTTQAVQIIQRVLYKYEAAFNHPH